MSPSILLSWTDVRSQKCVGSLFVIIDDTKPSTSGDLLSNAGAIRIHLNCT